MNHLELKHDILQRFKNLNFAGKHYVFTTFLAVLANHKYLDDQEKLYLLGLIDSIVEDISEVEPSLMEKIYRMEN